MDTPWESIQCLWNGWSHPDAMSHFFFGDVVAYGLLRAIKAAADPRAHPPHSFGGDAASGLPLASMAPQQAAACWPRPPPTRFHKGFTKPAYCSVYDANTTTMTVDKPASFQPLLNTGCWKFFADTPGKPGAVSAAAHACENSGRHQLSACVSTC